MEYRVLELLAFARNNVVTRTMLLKHLYRRSDDQPQPKIIDVFISKLRKKLRLRRRRRVHRDDPAARLDLRDMDAAGKVAQYLRWSIHLSLRSRGKSGMIHFLPDRTPTESPLLTRGRGAADRSSPCAGLLVQVA